MEYYTETGNNNLILDGKLTHLKPEQNFNKGLICIPTHAGYSIIRLDEIIYCQAKRSYCVFILCNNKTIITSKPLFNYDRLLPDSRFFRIHKSFLINLSHVKEYLRGFGGTVVMTNGIELDVSRRKKEEFLNRLKEFFLC